MLAKMKSREPLLGGGSLRKRRAPACRDYIHYPDVSATTSLGVLEGTLKTRSDCRSGVHRHPIARGRDGPRYRKVRQLCSPFVDPFPTEVAMANKSLFASLMSHFARADSQNEAGGPAYQFTPKHALAQLAATGCFNGRLLRRGRGAARRAQTLLELVDDNAFLARLALYSRQRADEGHAGRLGSGHCRARIRPCSTRSSTASSTMGTLRTFVQFVRSGQFGRRSLSYSLQTAVSGG